MPKTPESAPLIIDKCHETYGHIGTWKCFRTLNEYFHFPKFENVIRQRLASCKLCQLNKVTNKTCYSEMRNISPNKPGEILSMDFYGPLPPPKGGFKYIMSTINVFSKYTTLYMLRRATIPTAIRKIFKDCIPKFGKPEKILCDQDIQFTSSNLTEKLKQEGVEAIFTSIQHPQANPVERIH